MALTLHTTIGSNIANSYVSLSEAQDIVDGLIEDDDVVAWASSTTDQKNRACHGGTLFDTDRELRKSSKLI